MAEESRVMSSKVIRAFTFFSLLGSFILCWVWFLADSGLARFEPVVTALGIVGGVIGVFADRAAARRELREQSLRSLSEELQTNIRLLTDPRFMPDHSVTPRPRVYPRLRSSAVDVILTSAAATLLDQELLGRLRLWRDTVHEFNRRLDLTEMRSFLVNNPQEIRDLDNALHRQDGYLDDVLHQLTTLGTYLVSAPEAEKSGSAPAKRPKRFADQRRPTQLKSKPPTTPIPGR
jgi:hypothetical protein